MVLLDTNVFIIDRFFPRDAHYQASHGFLQSLTNGEAGISVFTLLELCGIASFNLAAKELSLWLEEFPRAYPVRVLNPHGVGLEAGMVWLGAFLEEMSIYIARKMTFGDALLLREAERYAVAAIITWNTKHFAQRTQIPVFTPATYVQQHLNS